MTGFTTKRNTKTKSNTTCITGLDSWLEAWSLYAGVLTTSNPQIAPDLFQYQTFITRSIRRFLSSFRAYWLSADATKCTTACFVCGSPNHLATECPLKQSDTSRCPVCNTAGHSARKCPNLIPERQAQSMAKPDDDSICSIYNCRGSCFRSSRCPYSHSWDPGESIRKGMEWHCILP